MAKKNKNNIDENIENNIDELEDVDFEEGKKKSKAASIGLVLLIILVWLGIFAALVKLDVGGFGSTVMSPILKDIPIVNSILPNTDDASDVTNYPYKSLGEAITYIKELEVQQQDYEKSIAELKEKVADLQSENTRLQAFEDDQTNFNSLKSKFYEEVVFGEKALSYDEYKKYYESIDPANAEKLYQQVLEKYMVDEQYTELANAYSQMKPKKAAAALYEMTGNLDTVVTILKSMDSKKRALILDALSDIDSVYCAKVTVLLAP